MKELLDSVGEPAGEAQILRSSDSWLQFSRVGAGNDLESVLLGGESSVLELESARDELAGVFDGSCFTRSY